MLFNGVWRVFIGDSGSLRSVVGVSLMRTWSRPDDDCGIISDKDSDGRCGWRGYCRRSFIIKVSQYINLRASYCYGFPNIHMSLIISY